MRENNRDRPLDQTTARIVDELAAAMLPHLRETLTEETARFQTLPDKVEETLKALLAALGDLQKIGTEATESLDAAERSMEERLAALSSAALASVERAGAAVDSLEANAANLLKATGDSPQPEIRGAEPPQSGEILRTLRLLETSIPVWEGILKAEGRAQTRELSELSAEVTELLRDTGEESLRKIEKILMRWESLEKERTQREERFRQSLEDSGRSATRRLLRLEVAIYVLGAAVFALLVAVLWG